MKIIGEKLSNQEMLKVKGGEATCYCLLDDGSHSGNFTMPSGDVGVILAAAQQYCNSTHGTSSHAQCNGLDVEWE